MPGCLQKVHHHLNTWIWGSQWQVRWLEMQHPQKLLIYAKKIKGRQLVFMVKGRQFATRKKELASICVCVRVHFLMQRLDISKTIQAYIMIRGYEWGKKRKKVVVRKSLSRRPKITSNLLSHNLSVQHLDSRFESSPRPWMTFGRLAFGYTFMWPWSLRKCHFQT